MTQTSSIWPPSAEELAKTLSKEEQQANLLSVGEALFAHATMFKQTANIKLKRDIMEDIQRHSVYTIALLDSIEIRNPQS